MTQPGGSYLVRLDVPASGDTIHRNTCRIVRDRPVVRWQYADVHPDEDWRKTAPWLHACSICKPPSPARELLDVA
jgi:hypothetical protein